LFRNGEKQYGVPDPDFAEMGSEMLNEKRYTVADLTEGGKKKFLYEYDFGDSWTHEVKVEKVLPPDTGFEHPVCLAGENACPPEDCGGIPGYYRFVEIIGNPKHPEHEEMKEWHGGEWDAAEFDVNSANRELKGIEG
ncbi:MAG: plasmid pRiA4b ORF-3 family protein, partial [Limisphaerales bacterium]